MPKKILHGADARTAILEGLTAAADIVGVTLGPKGRNVLIEESYGPPKITKDGVTVAKKVSFKNKEKDLGAKLLTTAATKTNDVAGDGTTTTCELLKNMAIEGVKYVTAGMNPMALRKGMEKATNLVIEEITKKARSVQTTAEIEQVATISANGDKEIGKKLAEAFEKVGKDGVITVEEANKSEGFEVEVTEGMSFDRGYISPYFITNVEKMITEHENAYILIVDKKITTVAQILPLLEKIVKTGSPLLIIAEDLDTEPLTTLVLNVARGGLKVVAVKAPGFGDRRKAMLQDIATITGAEVISEELGYNLEKVDIAMLGKARKIIVKKENTIIVGGQGDKGKIEARITQIKSEIDQSTSDYDKEKLQERLAKLAGGIGVVRIGGITEVAAKEKKDLVEDALNATKAALEQGVGRGGGWELLRASKVLEGLKGENEDEQAGINLVRKSLAAPVTKILQNAGQEHALIIAKLLENRNENMIFDAQKGQEVDAFEAGIIDPIKSIRIALESATSVAGSLITTEGAITDEPEDKPAGGMDHAAHMGGGMGGF